SPSCWSSGHVHLAVGLANRSAVDDHLCILISPPLRGAVTGCRTMAADKARRQFARGMRLATRTRRNVELRLARRGIGPGVAFESRLVWILGSPRSGSTWLLRMLGSLPGVVP